MAKKEKEQFEILEVSNSAGSLTIKVRLPQDFAQLVNELGEELCRRLIKRQIAIKLGEAIRKELVHNGQVLSVSEVKPFLPSRERLTEKGLALEISRAFRDGQITEEQLSQLLEVKKLMKRKALLDKFLAAGS